jgi:hypothetical protein
MMIDESKLEMNRVRTQDFARYQKLEDVLKEVNLYVASISLHHYSIPKYPVIFIMGCPRSGSTLMLQWLSSLGLFTYPSNIIARFYSNPYLGAKIQQILVDYDKENQIGLNSETLKYESTLGKAKGALSPSEFWYYWRQFYQFGEIQKLSDEQLKTVDTKLFVKGLAGLEAAYDLPMVLKGMILNWHIPHLNNIFEKVLFINVIRDDFFNAQSLYFARKKFYGNFENWFSYKPIEYEFLKNEVPLIQVAGQVVFTKKAVSEGLSTIIPKYKKLNVDYEQFCEEPSLFYYKLRKKLSQQGYDIPIKYNGLSQFESMDDVRLNKNEILKLRSYLEKFNSNL